ncbi:MAG TPA: peptidoglycan DD-metalloendopeptidase family protein [Thermoanaerobaculia bacterium]|nr:peptidoglycan DD-metalloendopeptidase family protein [Thermoanaerobaculia bacterium]
MSLLRIHPYDPRRKSRSIEIGPRAGIAFAAFVLLAGGASALGLFAAPRIVFDLVHAAERRAVGETARRGAEAFASVGRRALALGARVAADELFLARVAAVIEVPPPAGVPAEAPEKVPATASELESETSEIARRLRVLELFRRSLAALPAPEPGGFRPAAVPSRSPVEPSTAVPISVYGEHESPITREPEFETGLTLASPAGSPVTATAEGTVLSAGPVSRRADAAWRRLGVVVVLAHDARTRTVYGNLSGVMVRRGQRVGRGQALARVGTSGFAPTPRVHYEVQRLVNGRWVARDPRLFILDEDWIGARELRKAPAPPEAADLPPERR